MSTRHSKDENDIMKIERLFEKYKNLMYKVAYRILNDKYASEEALQRSYFRIFDNLNKIDENNEQSTKVYLVIICRNIAIDIYNRREKENERFVELNEDLYDESKTVENIVFGKESLNRVLELMFDLDPKKYREVMLLRYAYSHSIAEISVLLSIDEAAVRKRIERGKKKLLKLMEKDSTEGRRNNHEQ